MVAVVMERHFDPGRVRSGSTHEATFHSVEGNALHVYLTINRHPETNQPIEVFIVTSKQGTVIRGLFDTVAILLSRLMQYGASAAEVADLADGISFEPRGSTGDAAVPEVASVVDWVVQRLLLAAVTTPSRGLRTRDAAKDG